MKGKCKLSTTPDFKYDDLISPLDSVGKKRKQPQICNDRTNRSTKTIKNRITQQTDIISTWLHSVPVAIHCEQDYNT